MDSPKRRKPRWLRWTLGLLALAVAAIVALSFHQPPMRLMPTPEVFRQSGSAIFAAAPERARDTGIEVFYATNRLAVGPRTNRLYAVTPGRDLAFGIGTIAIGDRATTWEQVYGWSTGTSDDTRPWLRLQAMHELGAIRTEDAAVQDAAALSAGMRGWLALVNAALARSPDKDIIIYVHGANSTVERAVGQAAQLRHFTGGNAVVVLFAWPTAENFLRYPADLVTAFGAAPQLARLVELLAANTGAHHIDVLTYSAGGMVGTSAMAQLGRDVHGGAPDPRLGEVYYAAPDTDFRDFVSDLKDYAGVPQRITVAANMHDSALRLSELVNRASRAGRPDLGELSAEASTQLLSATHLPGFDVIQIRPGDIPGLSRTSHTFWYEDPWVSSDVLITFLFHLAPAERGLEGHDAPSGARYYAFPPDYPERLPGVMAKIRAGASSSPLP